MSPAPTALTRTHLLIDGFGSPAGRHRRPGRRRAGMGLLALAGCASWGYAADVGSAQVGVGIVVSAADASGFARRTQDAFDTVGVAYRLVSESDLPSADLSQDRVLVLPYATKLANNAVARVTEFVGAGGKVVAFFGLPEAWARALGGMAISYLQDGDGGRFHAIHFAENVIQGLPGAVIQNSWWAFLAAPLGDTRVIGHWTEASGKTTEIPAAFLSPTGAIVGHVLTTDDLRAKGRLLLALVAHFQPDQWRLSFVSLRDGFGKVGAYPSLIALGQHVEAAKDRVAPDVHRAAIQRLAAAEESKREAEEHAGKGEDARAVEVLLTAQEQLESALYPPCKRLASAAMNCAAFASPALGR